MYESFFNLNSKPFELVPNPRFLYLSRGHRAALAHLEYGLKEGAGFILLTGEVGSGKTTIIRDILRRLDGDVVPAMIFNTRVTPKQLLAMISEEFGLAPAGKDKVSLLRDLNEFLIDCFGRGSRPTIIIDEAQNLSREALEEVRLLSNLEAADARLLQIILIGQPELDQIIARPDLRQLRQRIAIRCHLHPLSQSETMEYILHRLETAGNRAAIAFGEGTVEIIYRYSSGIPRLINVFCDFLLLSAFIDEKRELTLEMVQEVVGEAAGNILDPQVKELPEADPPAESKRLADEVALLGEKLNSHEKVLRSLVRRQRDDDRRMQASIDRIADILEALPARFQAALRESAVGEEKKSDKVIRLKNVRSEE